MDEVFHLRADDPIGNSVFSRYYSSQAWAERKLFELRRNKSVVNIAFRVLRGDWEEINV